MRNYHRCQILKEIEENLREKGAMPTYLAYLPKGIYSPTSDKLKIKMIKRKMQYQVDGERLHSNSPRDNKASNKSEEGEEKEREKGESDEEEEDVQKHAEGEEGDEANHLYHQHKDVQIGEGVDKKGHTRKNVNCKEGGEHGEEEEAKPTKSRRISVMLAKKEETMKLNSQDTPTSPQSRKISHMLPHNRDSPPASSSASSSFMGVLSRAIGQSWETKTPTTTTTKYTQYPQQRVPMETATNPPLRRGASETALDVNDRRWASWGVSQQQTKKPLASGGQIGGRRNKSNILHSSRDNKITLTPTITSTPTLRVTDFGQAEGEGTPTFPTQRDTRLTASLDRDSKLAEKARSLDDMRQAKREATFLTTTTTTTSTTSSSHASLVVPAINLNSPSTNDATTPTTTTTTTTEETALPTDTTRKPLRRTRSSSLLSVAKAENLKRETKKKLEKGMSLENALFLARRRRKMTNAWIGTQSDESDSDRWNSGADSSDEDPTADKLW